jgi:hypothetical protein
MRAAVVVEADPVADDARRVLDAFEAVPVSALLFQRPDHALDHAVIRHDQGGALGPGSAIVLASGAWGIGST